MCAKLLVLACLPGVLALSFSRAQVTRQRFLGSAAVASGFLSAAPAMAADFRVSESGLKYTDAVVGTGAVPTPGQTVSVHYTGWLNDFGDLDGKFDSSYDRGKPLSFAVGTGKVIKGWDEALLSMPIGTTRKVIIPPDLGYGKRGAGGIIPPDATLYFEMKLIAIK